MRHEFTWTKNLSVWNARLDSDHQNLINLVNQLECAIRSKDRGILSLVFSELIDAINSHFVIEKKFAQAINCPFAEHELLHYYVQKELHIMNNELGQQNERWSESVAEYYSYFLSEWFSSHLIEDVILLKPILKTYPYNFNLDDSIEHLRNEPAERASTTKRILIV